MKLLRLMIELGRIRVSVLVGEECCNYSGKLLVPGPSPDNILEDENAITIDVDQEKLELNNQSPPSASQTLC